MPVDDTPLPDTAGPVLSIDPTGRYFRRDGRPFWWVADTAWLLGWVPTQAQITQYLEDRHTKGVRVIQGPIIGRETVTPPHNGGADDPFVDSIPMRLNDAWWAATDHAVGEAARLGMNIVVAPVWGPNADTMIPDPARFAEYVALVARRYSNQAHVVWLPSGEYHKITYTEAGSNQNPLTPADIARLRFAVTAIRANAHPDSLIYFHPNFWKQPSEHWGQDARVAFNSLQSSGSLQKSITMVPAERSSTLTKPVIEGETGYEDATHSPWKQRLWAYHALMQGAGGVTYGHALVWKFAAGWEAALGAEGGVDVLTHFRNFAESIHAEGNTPAQSLVLTPGSNGDTGNSFASALRNADSSRIYAFVSNGRTFNVNLNGMDSGSLSARWYDPRNGVYSAPFPVTRSASVALDPPGVAAEGNDYALVITSTPPPVAGTGRLSVAIQLPTENEDGTALRTPLRIDLERTPPSGGLVAPAQHTASVAWIDGVPVGTYQVRARAVDADGEISTWSNSTTSTVQGGNPMALTITTLTAVGQSARPSGDLSLTFTRATGSGGLHTLFFAVTKEGTSVLTSAGITFDGSATPVKALANSQGTLEPNWMQWFYVENVGSGSHTITVANTSGNDLSKAIMGATVEAGSGFVALPIDALTNVTTATSGTSLNASVTVDANDLVLAGCSEGETGVHAWTGTGTFTEFSDLNGLSESSSAAYQSFGTGGSKTVTCDASPGTINRLINSAIVVREMDLVTVTQSGVGTAALDLAVGKPLSFGGSGSSALDLGVGINRAFGGVGSSALSTQLGTNLPLTHTGVGTADLDFVIGKAIAISGIGTADLTLNVGINRAFDGSGTSILDVDSGAQVNLNMGGVGTADLVLGVGKPLEVVGVGSSDLTLNVGKFFGYSAVGMSVLSLGANEAQAGNFTGIGTSLLETVFTAGASGLADPASRFKEPFDLSYWRTKYERQQAGKRAESPAIEAKPQAVPRVDPLEDSRAALQRIRQRDLEIDQDIANLSAYIDSVETVIRARSSQAEARRQMIVNAMEAEAALQMVRKRAQQLRNQRVAIETVIRLLLA